ncbi:MAG: hydroxymethylbilane synthase [Lachnospiraceae bacterium]|nr:hydroxymethylbilane synthase [Lachnospiraceae bacterium]
MKKIKLATRGSRLALVQARLVRDILAGAGVAADEVIVSARGDRNKVSPLIKIGGNGLFVREIEKSLLAGEADIAVHCGKDLPFELDERLVIAGVTSSADCRDCLVMPEGKSLTKASVIGTGSPRRIAEFPGLHNDIEFKDIRGNITTRLEKLRQGDYDGVILAKAGLDRIGFDGEGYDIRVYEPYEMIPAACQGILALECRRDDEELCRLVESISDEATMRRFEVERYMFCRLRADCSAAVGIYAKVDERSPGELNIMAMYEGRRAEISGRYEDYRELCEELYAKLT